VLTLLGVQMPGFPARKLGTTVTALYLLKSTKLGRKTKSIKLGRFLAGSFGNSRSVKIFLIYLI
jgi:hypothetical protein